MNFSCFLGRKIPLSRKYIKWATYTYIGKSLYEIMLISNAENLWTKIILSGFCCVFYCSFKCSVIHKKNNFPVWYNFLLFITFTSDSASDSKQFRIRICKVNKSKGREIKLCLYKRPVEVQFLTLAVIWLEWSASLYGCLLLGQTPSNTYWTGD